MSKITSYTSLPSVRPDDMVPVVDVHDTAMASSGTTKRVTVASLLATGGSGLVGLAPSGDTSGATDYANITGLLALSGIAILQAGQFYLGSNSLSFIQKQSLIAAGSSVTQIYYAGSGTAINVALSGSFTGGAYGGVFEGFYLDGYSAGGSAVGFQHGDLQGTTVSDVAVYGFAGKGAYFANTAGRWSEQMNIRMRLVQCGTYGTNSSGSVVFDTSSFDYSNFDFLFGNTSPPAHGLVMQGGAQIQGCHLRMRGNFYGRASANASAVIAIDPGNASGTSYIANTMFDAALEGDGSGVGPWLVLMGSSNSTSQFLGSGVLSFANAGVSTQGISNANFLPFAFDGTLGTGANGAILSFGQEYLLSTDGTNTSNGAIRMQPYGRAIGIVSTALSSTAWFVANIASTSGHIPCFGGAGGHGIGISGDTTSLGDVCFGVQNGVQGGYGLGGCEFTVYDNANVVTFNNTLDDGSGNLAVAGGLTSAVRTIIASGAVTATDSLLLLNAATLTATLPTAVGKTGRVYTVKLVAASTTGTVATTSSQTIDGSTTYSLSAQRKYVTVQSDGANWQIIANN